MLECPTYTLRMYWMSWNLESSGNIDFYISCTYYLLLAEDSLLLVDTELRIVNGLFC